MNLLLLPKVANKKHLFNGAGNIKIQMFKIQNKNGFSATLFFGHWYFDHLNLFRVSIFEFIISPSIRERLKCMSLFDNSNCHFKLQNL